MNQNIFLHSPTLASVIMVEKTVQKHSQECGKYQLWKKLPKKMMYQTFQHILKYLEGSGKVMVDKEGCVIWIHNPARINNLRNNGLLVGTDMKNKTKVIKLNKLQALAVPLLKKYGVKRAGIFGSMARGDAKRTSDLDLLIDLKQGATLFDMAGLKVDLEDAIGRTVDLVEYGMIKPELRAKILSEEVAIL
jgi:uncharacterized protein